LPPSLRTREFDRILLIKPSALGDVIHTIPLLVKLRARYPKAQIDWLLTPQNAELLRCHPALSNVVLFERHEFARFGQSWSATSGLMELLRKIRRARYDLAIDMHGQFRSALFVMASGAATRIGFRGRVRRDRSDYEREGRKNVPVRGWAGAREGSWLAYTHRIPIPTLSVHAADRYLWVGPMLGLDDTPLDFTIYLPPEADIEVDRLLAEAGLLGKPLAVLMPGTVWETKHWRLDGFTEVARYLVGHGYAVALAGSAREQPRCKAVASACPEARDVSGRTTPAHLAALIQRAGICVTNDSGPMHLAVALNRPVVSVFGPTDPVCIGPYRRPDAVVRLDLDCSPCNYRKLSQCPYDHACMNGVSGQMVIERIERVLSANPIHS
jgi:lipopolysaccharide heptosyltransferase I